MKSDIGVFWTCIRALLFIFNLIFWLAGTAIVGFGAWILIKYKSIFSLDSSQTWLAGPGLLIAVGSIIFIIAFFGCCGAFRDSRACLYIFSFFLSLMFIVTVAAVILVYIYQNKVKDSLSKALFSSMLKYSEEDDNSIRATWDNMQADWPVCCGTYHWEDWKATNYTQSKNMVPESCCNNTNPSCNVVDNPSFSVHQTGCYNQTVDAVDNSWPIIGGIAGCLAGIELTGIFFACGLAKAISRGAYEYV
eukprot:m.307084 g.307084  ORF g.307084 m.307084 type:complete len:248 (+) comp41881_c0_seq1:102-845(+)